jgi:CHASE2 domain-containing sensor protein
MPPRASRQCDARTTTEALARDELSAEQRAAAEQHIEQCPLCQIAYRRLTAGRFPRIRNYTILSELGRGGFGVVYRAVHHSKKRTEALKVLPGKSAQRTAYFENEVRLVAKLRHPNIATLFEANLTSAPLYYSMELVPGEHLDAYFRDHDLPLERRIELVRMVAVAVGYAHQQGVIHRDLKPQNILIDADGQPRIVDFGIAKRLGFQAEFPRDDDGRPRGPEGVLGTFGYIAPEQMAGQDVDRRADIYSLGALLFHIITGQAARFASQTERLTAVLRQREVSRAADLAAIIACCVRPAPEERYATCEGLVADLDNYLAGRPIQARTDATPGYLATRVAALVLRRHPLRAQIAAVLLVAALLVGALWYAPTGWLSQHGSDSQVALIAFTPGTLEAVRRGELGADLPGLSLDNRKSWRLLYGRLLETLADARPAVVVWDYFFPACAPDYDPAFVHGLHAVGAPVVVGSEEFDVNGEPELCPDLRAAVHGWGALKGSGPSLTRDCVVCPLAIQRGFNPPIPSLAIAATAALRHPDCDVDLLIEPEALALRYRKRQPQPQESRWLPQVHRFRTFRPDEALKDEGGLASGDRISFARVALGDITAWAPRVVPVEQVFAAGGSERRAWFGGRAVLIGQMLPSQDEWRFSGNVSVFGCQVQAAALDSLLRDTHFYRASRLELVARVLPWAVLAVLVTRRLPVPGTWRRRITVPVSIALVVLAVAAAGTLPAYLTQRTAVEALLAGLGLLGCGTMALLVRLLHERQLHLTPDSVWSAEDTTASAQPWTGGIQPSVEARGEPAA